MKHSYQFHERAQHEYEEALLWYMQRSQKAAENFVIAVDHALELICAHPTRWRNQYKHYHELGISKYPYTIIYFIEPDKQLIIISAIYHHKRNPKKKYRK